MRRLRAGDWGFSSPPIITCSGFNLDASFVSSRITRCRFDLATLGSSAILWKFRVFSGENAKPSVRRNGSTAWEIWSAWSGVNPRGKNVGKVEPDLCAPAAVVALIAGSYRWRDG